MRIFILACSLFLSNLAFADDRSPSGFFDKNYADVAKSKADKEREAREKDPFAIYARTRVPATPLPRDSDRLQKGPHSTEPPSQPDFWGSRTRDPKYSEGY